MNQSHILINESPISITDINQSITKIEKCITYEKQGHGKEIISLNKFSNFSA